MLGDKTHSATGAKAFERGLDAPRKGSGYRVNTAVSPRRKRRKTAG